MKLIEEATVTTTCTNRSCGLCQLWWFVITHSFVSIWGVCWCATGSQ